MQEGPIPQDEDARSPLQVSGERSATKLPVSLGPRIVSGNQWGGQKDIYVKATGNLARGKGNDNINGSRKIYEDDWQPSESTAKWPTLSDIRRLAYSPLLFEDDTPPSSPFQDVQYDSPQNTEQKASHHLQEGMAQHLYAPCSAASHQAKDSLSYLLEDPEAPRADHPAAFQQTSTHAGQEGSSPPGLPPRKPLGSGTRREGRRGLQERGPPGAVWRVRRTSTSSFPSPVPVKQPQSSHLRDDQLRTPKRARSDDDLLAKWDRLNLQPGSVNRRNLTQADLQRIRAWVKAPILGQSSDLRRTQSAGLTQPLARPSKRHSANHSASNATAAAATVKAAKSSLPGLEDEPLQPSFGRIYAFLGSMFDPVYCSLDHAAAMKHMNKLDRHLLHRILSNCVYNLSILGFPEELLDRVSR